MAGTELAKAYVQIIPSTNGLKGKLTSALNGEAGAAGSSAGNVAGSNLAASIKNVIMTAGIGIALKNSIMEGANLQQSLGGIETLFKDSADKVIANAKIAYKTAGMSANEYMETVTSFSASLLQGLAGDTNKAADIADMALTDMSDNANKMGTSMELIQNAYQGFAKQNYTMLDNLKLGYGGTKTEMQRLLADATKLSGVKYDLSNLSDVYEAIHVIQEEMGITGTTAKEAASTLSGSLASMKASFSDLLGNLALGEDIKPALNALSETVFTFLGANLFPMIGNVLSSLPQVIEKAFSMAIRSLNMARRNADVIIENGLEIMEQLVVGIISATPYLIESSIKLVTSLGSTLISADWIGIASEMLTALRDNLNLASGEILGSDGAIVDSIFNSVINALPKMSEFIYNTFSNLWNGCIQIWNAVGVPIFNTIVEMIKYVANNWNSINATISTLFQTMWDVCNTIWTTIGQPMWNAISVVLGEVTGLFSQYMPAIMGFFQTAIAGIKDTWDNHLKPVFEAISTFLQNVLKPAFEFVFDTIIKPLVDRTFKFVVDIWNNTLKPVFDGICDFLTGVFTGDWKKAFNGILSIVTGVLKGVETAFNTCIEFAKDVVSKGINKIKEFFDFDWSLPKLKLPHFSITGKFSIDPPSVPSFGIEWYAKAMNEPVIMNSPTAFGINSLGQIMAGGEAGSEVVSGTDTLMKMIASVVASQNVNVANTMNDGFNNLIMLLNNYLPELANMQLVMDTGAVIAELSPAMDSGMDTLITRKNRGW